MQTSIFMRMENVTRQTENPDCRFSAVYRIFVNDHRTIDQHAQDITVEQTVEIPVDCIPQEIVRGNILGRVENIVPSLTRGAGNKGNLFDVTISYRCDLTEYALPQFLNVLFGNISLKNNIKVTGLKLPGSFLAHFAGPTHGIDGIRKMLGVFGRPLACTALKPVGLKGEKLAAMAAQCARGGIDMIKDDHGISNQPFHPFKERVARCQEAVARENAISGRMTLYCPMVSGRFEEIEEQVEYARRQGVRGILIAPMLVGWDTARYLSRSYGMAVAAHPSLTGVFFHSTVHGMTPPVLLGSIFRLIGADISIFPNAGGRFFFTREECRELSKNLTEPMGSLKSSFPCPAGGMSLEMIEELGGDFGEDAVFLIGGALMQRSTDPSEAVKAFMDEIRLRFHERLENPDTGFLSSCEVKSTTLSGAVVDVLRCDGFRWAQGGRTIETYKPGDGGDFKLVTRQELMGKFGEKTSFDLRYFEIGTGGYSSLEKHVHEHVIIGARGKGMLVKKDGSIAISPNDIAYVGPLEAHQLRNESPEPFGFYCIVDHNRDKPMSA
jgi:ribulose-bisphosphate carboxylase large chain